MAQQVAVDIDRNGEFVLMDLVAVKGGWTTVLDANGIEHKVRNSEVAMADDDEPITDYMTDDEDDEPRGDVFPVGARERYVRTKVEREGKKRTLIDCGDQLAYELRGKSLQAVAEMAAEVVGELSADGWLRFYREDRIAAGKGALNDGMIRMNLGNRIRAALKRAAEEAADSDEG